MSGACFFNAPIQLTRLLTPQSQTAHPDFLFSIPIAKCLDEIFPDPKESIFSPNIPDTDRTRPVTGPFHVPVSFIRGCISTIKIEPLKVTKCWNREKTTLFPTRPVSWIPNRTVPWIKQNTVLEPRISPAFAITFFCIHCNILDLKIHQSMWIHWPFFPKTWTKGHWPLDDLWPHVCWGHMCDSTQGSLCPSPMTIHQCMWIEWSILQNTTYIHTPTYIHTHTYYVQNEWSHSLLLNSVQARQKYGSVTQNFGRLHGPFRVSPTVRDANLSLLADRSRWNQWNQQSYQE